jgi:hypothetical protein
MDLFLSSKARGDCVSPPDWCYWASKSRNLLLLGVGRRDYLVFDYMSHELKCELSLPKTVSGENVFPDYFKVSPDGKRIMFLKMNSDELLSPVVYSLVTGDLLASFSLGDSGFSSREAAAWGTNDAIVYASGVGRCMLRYVALSDPYGSRTNEVAPSSESPWDEYPPMFKEQ